MRDIELANLRPHDLLVDARGRVWRVVHSPIREDVNRTHWTRIISGAYTIRLDFKNRDEFGLQPAPQS